MLTDARHDRNEVINIALACGFNEVSYFNRCFRRHFGATPTDIREPPQAFVSVQAWLRQQSRLRSTHAT
jgi:AraC-like DNA-binding protein